MATLLLVQFIYGHLDSIEQAIVTIVLVLEAFFLFLIVQTMVLVTGAMHGSTPLLYRAQMMLKTNTGSTLTAKLKLATFYELMHTEKRCSFHLGNLAAVTKKSCVDVSFYKF